MVRRTRKMTRRTRPRRVTTSAIVHRNIENKFWQQPLTNFGSINTSWREYDLSNITQGTDLAYRIGRRIRITGVSIRGVIVGGQANLGTDDSRNVVRIVLALWDSSTNSPCTTNTVGLEDMINKRTPEGKGLFRKYVDKYLPLTSPGRDSVGYMPAQRSINIFKKMNVDVTYDSSVSTTANRRVILSMISDSTLVTNPGFVTGFYTVFFEDA